MKTYQVNTELTEILIANGFRDFSTEKQNSIGKKTFRLSKNSNKEIYFDYTNIVVSNANSRSHSRLSLTEVELKSLIFYFKLDAAEQKEINESGLFDYQSIAERIKAMRSEVDFFKQQNKLDKKRIKLQNIVQAFDNVELN